jgi:L-lactate dehydrogenase complex protein LldG
MSTSTTPRLDAFVDSLGELDVPATRTDPEGFPAALAEAVETPAVGVELPFGGVSLADADVPIDTEPTAAAVDGAACSVTAAEFAIANYGSVVLRSAPDGVEPASLYADHHVAVVRADDVLPDMNAAFDRLGDLLRDGESAVVATGPSATADMGELVRGAHGPKSVQVIVLT